MKKTVAALVVFCFLPVSATVSGAQTSAKGVGCMGPHRRPMPDHWSVTCNGQAECDAVLARHNREEHGGISQTPVREVPRTPAQAVTYGIVAGAGLGALGGSLNTSKAGNNQWANGALGGAGTMAVLAVTANAPKINPVVGAVVATAGGAATGTAWARYQMEQGKADTTKRDAAIGGGGGLLIYTLAKVTGGSKPQWSPRFLGRHGRIELLASPRLTGVRVRW